jgi:hypothetical protein
MSTIRCTGMLIAALLAAPIAHGASTTAPAGGFRIPLFATKSERLEGILAKRDFLFRIPGHIRLEPGSTLTLLHRSSPLLVDDVSTMTVSVNGERLTSTRLGDGGTEPRTGTLTAAIPDNLLKEGWNRVSIACLLQTTEAPCRDVDNPAAWVELGTGSAVSVAGTEIPQFPELQRFPDSVTEPLLMTLPEYSSALEREPVLSILYPADGGDEVLRAMFIAAARLGQPGYVEPGDIRLGPVDDWQNDSASHGGILIGTRGDLEACDLPEEITKPLAELKPGEGLVRDFITPGSSPAGNRWILVTGVDGPGLEKAALALANSPALRRASSNPLVVRDTPRIPPMAARAAQPLPGPATLDAAAGGGIELRGLFRQATSRPVHFPPGFETAPGGTIALDLSHAGNLANTSAVEIRFNDTPVASIPLTAGNTVHNRIVLPVPENIAGRDPSLLTVSGYMDIGTVDCAHRNEERAWLNIDGASVMDLKHRPLRIRDLGRLQLLCLRDALLRRAAVLVPAEPSIERDELLKRLALFLGKNLPDMPVLDPQVATYAPGLPPAKARVADRSGFVLGSAFQWADAFDGGDPLVVEGGRGGGESLTLRGEQVPSTDFDPTVCFAQLMPSPWSKDAIYATVGGIQGYGGEAAVDMLTDPSTASKLSGTVAAIDAEGRVATYDVRVLEELALSERLRQGLAHGLSSDDALTQGERDLEDARIAGMQNIWIASGVLGALGALFAVQRVAVWRRRRHQHREEP